MDRRTLLQATGALGTAALAGCSGLLGGGDDGNGSALLATSFEGESLPDALAVDSEADAPPVALTTKYASDGPQSLRLASRPGQSSKVVVTAADPLEDVSSYRLTCRRLDEPTPESSLSYPTVEGDPSPAGTGEVVTRGDEHSAGIDLRHADTDARLRVGINRYYGEVRARSIDRAGEDVRTEAVVGTPLSSGWHELAIELDGDTAVMGVGETKTEVPVPPAFEDGALLPVVTTNAWDNGNHIAVAVDEFEVA